MTVAVIGATGNTGRAVVSELRIEDLVGRAPITTKQFAEDFKPKFS